MIDWSSRQPWLTLAIAAVLTTVAVVLAVKWWSA